jgi:16S rRNA (uracil1498-N3)-methyltransferase
MVSQRDGVKTPLAVLRSREHRLVDFEAGIAGENVAKQEKDAGAENAAPRRKTGPEAAQATLFYMARRRFFVDHVRSGHAQIQGDDAHHLTRVLRVEAGQKYEISDNRDVYLAEIETARKDLVSFTVIERIGTPETPVRITAAVALIKFERFEWLIEKATELGVESIVPIMAERSEKGLDLAAGKRSERWRRIAREASEQSRRARLPEISEILGFAEAVALKADLKLALDEQPGAAPILAALPRATSRDTTVALLVGPEGGWTERERSMFTASGWTPVSLGAAILRAETAAIAAISVVGSVWNGTAS